ncbi:hypothetical protein QTP88_022679 [Uroleucon formosanum]
MTFVNIGPPRLFNNVVKDCKPVAVKSRRYSDEDAKFIREEVTKLLYDNIIEESISLWRAQVLITKSENHKMRIVIDYSQTINKFTLMDAFPLSNIDELVSKVAQHTTYSTIDLRSAYHQIPIHEDERQYTAFEAGESNLKKQSEVYSMLLTQGSVNALTEDTTSMIKPDNNQPTVSAILVFGVILKQIIMDT